MNDDCVIIAGRRVGMNEPPFIVAELSGNHGGELATALALVDAAADAGVHAVKLQTYTPDTMTLDCEGRGFAVDDPASPWHGQRLYDLYGQASTPWDWHAAIFARCRERGLPAFSTPFDAQAVDFLEALDVPCHKISSFECTDLPLIRRVAATGKPLILSVGMATEQEIGEAIAAARGAGCRELVLLKCTSTYPAQPWDMHLRTIPLLREQFGCPVGLSDHSLGIGVAVAAVALGAVMIEKHLTLSRAGGAVDAAFSMEPQEFAQLVIETERAWQALGEARIGPSVGEQAALACRRSLYIARDLKAGEVVTADSLRAIRPGFGLAPKYYDSILGLRVVRDVAAGTPASWDLFERPST
ncbi:MAG: pseudaminic acid synthase [Chromatiales bacterium]|jgi:N-acetylneuraminate synthase|nr:pseudaminic acid synthase [Chromatiales bacterium]MDX9766131.1 pseudaminic acid synthase [Ectothiorhodospiraceae bacterium]